MEGYSGQGDMWIRVLICCALVLYPFAIDCPISSLPKALGCDISMKKCWMATLRVMAWPWDRVTPLMVMVASVIGVYSKGSWDMCCSNSASLSRPLRALASSAFRSRTCLRSWDTTLMVTSPFNWRVTTNVLFMISFFGDGQEFRLSTWV